MISVKTVLLSAGLLFVLFLSLVLASGAGWNPIGAEWNFENSGQFGDSFGFLSSFMAAAAAFAAWAAYRLQHAEIEHLRASEASTRALAEKQHFEQTFFNLLEMFREVVREIDVIGADGHQRQGRDALAEILREMHEVTVPAETPQEQPPPCEVFMAGYRRHREDLAHYFRLFYHIVKFVHEAPVDPKAIYIRLIRATLSNSEMELIGLDCMYGGGKSKLRPLVERYALLHNIAEASINRWNMLDGLGAGAFGDRSLSASARL